MNADGRITLYGGTPISLALVAVGGVTNEPAIALTGSYFAAATLALAFLFDYLDTSTYGSDGVSRGQFGAQAALLLSALLVLFRYVVSQLGGVAGIVLAIAIMVVSAVARRRWSIRL